MYNTMPMMKYLKVNYRQHKAENYKNFLERPGIMYMCRWGPLGQ